LSRGFDGGDAQGKKKKRGERDGLRGRRVRGSSEIGSEVYCGAFVVLRGDHLVVVEGRSSGAMLEERREVEIWVGTWM
jgi:hypothetical protein